MTVMTHVEVLEAGQSSQGTSEPITPALIEAAILVKSKRATRNMIFVITA